MSIVKSFSVGNGDMFYIKHNTDNFTVIDCCYDSKDEDRFNSNLSEIKVESSNRGIFRFISTHPDDDHIRGLKKFNGKLPIINFYCVANETQKTVETEDFDEYCNLRDGVNHFYIFKDCFRKWMNKCDIKRGSSGINVLWPNINNEEYKRVLENVKEDRDCNNLSPIITYSIENGTKFMWMGDMENDFREKVKDDIVWSKVSVLFAPHHGRKSGRVSSDILDKIQPQLIVVGEAPSEDLEYYSGYNTITQNTAGDITFDCENDYIHIFVEKSNYNPNIEILENLNISDNKKGYYIGSIRINSNI